MATTKISPNSPPGQRTTTPIRIARDYASRLGEREQDRNQGDSFHRVLLQHRHLVPNPQRENPQRERCFVLWSNLFIDSALKMKVP